MPDLKVELGSVDIDGVNLAFKKSGTGSPLILIHTHHPYAKYFLTSLPQKTNYQVLTVDIPGYYSEKQKEPVETIDQFIDLLAKLFDYLGFQKVDLSGECLGSVIVLKFAAKYPQKIRKLVVVSLPLRIFDSKIKKTLGPTLSFLKNNKIAGGLAKLLMRWNLWRGITNFLGGYQGLGEVFKQETLLVSKFNFDQKVFFGILSDLLKINPRQLLEKNRSDTLFVIGEKDKMTKRKEIIKFCQTRKNANYALVPKANHALVSKNTKEFNQIVTKFLLSNFHLGGGTDTTPREIGNLKK